MTNQKESPSDPTESWGWLRKTLYGKKTLLTAVLVMTSLGQGQLELLKQQLLTDNPGIAHQVALDANQVLDAMEVTEHPLFLEAKTQMEETTLRMEALIRQNELLEIRAMDLARSMEKQEAANAQLKAEALSLDERLQEQTVRTLAVKDEALKTAVTLQTELAEMKAKKLIAEERLQAFSTDSRRATPSSVSDVMYRLQNPPMPALTRPTPKAR